MRKSFRQMITEEGCIYYPQLFRGEELKRLHDACEHVLEKFTIEHNNERPGEDFKVVRHLHDPKWTKDAPEKLRTLLEVAADPRVTGIVEHAFEGRSLFKETSLWVNPKIHSEAGDWHRDSQFLYNTEEEERAYLDYINKRGLQRGVQCQIALVDNSDVEYVPYSQGRWDSPEENAIRWKGQTQNEMPHAKRFHMKAGDMIIFSQMGLHRGNYFVDNPRRTLMINYTSMDYFLDKDNHYKQDLSNSYLRSQTWMVNEGYLDGLSPRARLYFEEFIESFKHLWVS